MHPCACQVWCMCKDVHAFTSVCDLYGPVCVREYVWSCMWVGSEFQVHLCPPLDTSFLLKDDCQFPGCLPQRYCLAYWHIFSLSFIFIILFMFLIRESIYMNQNLKGKKEYITFFPKPVSSPAATHTVPVLRHGPEVLFTRRGGFLVLCAQICGSKSCVLSWSSFFPLMLTSVLSLYGCVAFQHLDSPDSPPICVHWPFCWCAAGLEV